MGVDPVPASAAPAGSDAFRLGAIQQPGILLVLDRDSFQVVQAAGDTAGVFGIAVTEVLQRDIAALIPPECCAEIRAFAAGDDRPEWPLPLFDLPGPDDGAAALQAFAHDSGGMIVLDLVPIRPDHNPSMAARTAMTRVQGMLLRTQLQPSIEAFLQSLADEVRAVSGFDRVAVSRFLADGTARIEAEARAADIAPWLGLHSPASDVPGPRRAAMRRNRVWVIPDVSCSQALLVPPLNPVTGRPTDLERSVLRAPDLGFAAFMTGHGAVALITLSLLVDGALWGVISCFNRQARFPTAELRAALAVYAQTVSFQLAAFLSAQAHEALLATRARRESLVGRLSLEPDVATGLARAAPALLEYVAADGMVLWIDRRARVFGRAPGGEQLANLLGCLSDVPGRDEVFATDRLAERLPSAAGFAGGIAGVALLALSPTTGDAVIWLREERVETIVWAGDPGEPVQRSAIGERMRPRDSFAAWPETIRGRSLPWTGEELDALRSLRRALLDVVVRHFALVAREREQAGQQQAVLMAELYHRMKNMLATVQALVGRSRNDVADWTTFIETLDSRIRALAVSHARLTASRWEGISLRVIVQDTLGAYMVGAEPLVIVAARRNPVLKPRAARALSFALFELGTNAAKHGALSVPGGRVHLRWRMAPGGGQSLVVQWRETGGPVVQPPTRRGFGRHLIETTLAYDVDGQVRLEFPPDGVRFMVAVPAAEVASMPEEGATEPAAAAAPDKVAADRMAAGSRILVVEDNSLLASSLALLLRTGGLQPVGPVGRLAAAIRLVEAGGIDAAILDIRLNSEPVWDVADLLEARRIPFAFSTGYQPDLALPARFAGRPVLSKPYSDRDLFDTIGALLRAPAG